MQINRKQIDDALKSFGPSLSEFDIDAVDASFTALLSHSHVESRYVIFDNVTRWGKLNRESGRPLNLSSGRFGCCELGQMARYLNS